jgi:hypothetical protein
MVMAKRLLTHQGRRPIMTAKKQNEQACKGELTDEQLDQVAGGDTKVTNTPVDVTLNKSIASNKAAAAEDAYIRG